MLLINSNTTRAISDLYPNPLNPRGPIDDESIADLVSSIRAQGILQPLLVTPEGIVVAGHRRLRAAQLAGLSEIPVVVRELAEREQIEIMLTENLQRQDLTPLQEARAFQRLADYGLSQPDIARRLGLQVNLIRDRLCILRLDEQVQAYFDRRELPVTLARPLSHVTDPAMQRRLAARSATRQMTVRDIEMMAERFKGEPKRERAPACQPTPKTNRWPGRKEAMAVLAKTPERTLTYADVLRVFDAACGVCRDCGMADLEVACRECPGPRMVQRMVEKW